MPYAWVTVTFELDLPRDAAWTHAEAPWALRPLPELALEYRKTLGGMVELVGRGLLIPTL